MTIFYLQRVKLFPTIENVQENLTPVNVNGKLLKTTKFIAIVNSSAICFIPGYQTQFDPSRSLQFYGVRKLFDFKDCIEGFFDFYEDLDYSSFIISPYNGRLEDKMFHE